MVDALLRPEAAVTDSQVDNALGPGGDEKEELATINNIKVTRGHMRCLRDREWLVDEVVNFYLEKLQQCSEDNTRLKCASFNTFMYDKVFRAKGGYCYTRNAKKWLWKKFKTTMLTYDKIFIPINLPNAHWMLAVVNIKEKLLQFYDSLAANGTEYLNNLRKLIGDYVMDMRAEYGATIEVDVQTWDIQNMEAVRQSNGYDCGMFMLKYVEHLWKDEPMQFTQADFPEFRRQTARMLLTHPPTDRVPETGDGDILEEGDVASDPKTNCGCSGCFVAPPPMPLLVASEAKDVQRAMAGGDGAITFGTLPAPRYIQWRRLGYQAQILALGMGTRMAPPGPPFQDPAAYTAASDNGAKLALEYSTRGRGESTVHVTRSQDATSGQHACHVDEQKIRWLRAELGGDEITAAYLIDPNRGALDDEPPLEQLATLLGGQLQRARLPKEGLRVLRCRNLQGNADDCTILAPLLAACGAEAPQLLGTAGWPSLDRAAWDRDVVAGSSVQGVENDSTSCPWRHRPATATNLRDVCVMIRMGQHQMLLRFMRRGNTAEATTLWERYKAAGSGVVCEDAALPWRT